MYDTSAKGVNRLRILLEQEQKMQNKGILKALALTTEYYGVDIFLLLKCFFTVKKEIFTGVWCSTIKLQR
jgi:hypothetical protein